MGPMNAATRFPRDGSQGFIELLSKYVTFVTIFILPWSKSSRNSFKKFKIQFYSSKVILSPSKYSLSTATHLCQRLIQLSKHFWNSIVGIAIRAVGRIFDFSITSFRLLKRVPRNGFLTRSNRKKSQRAISGESDGCWLISFLVKNSRIMMALCDVIMVQNPGVVCPQIQNRKYVQIDVLKTA